MEFALVFFICPAIVVIASIIGWMLWKKWFVMPVATFVVFTILTFTVFNETFFIWVFAYTLLSILTSFFTKSLVK